MFDSETEFDNLSLLEKVELLQHLLILHATGTPGENSEYKMLRAVLLSDEMLKPLVPRFIFSSRDLQQFWNYIKSKFATYAERRNYIYDEFSAVNLAGAMATFLVRTWENNRGDN